MVLCAVAMVSGGNSEPSVDPEDVRLARTPPANEPLTYSLAPLRGTATVSHGS